MNQSREKGFLSEAQHLQLQRFPENIHENELIQYFLLSQEDIRQIPVKSPTYSRLGFSILLCTLRFLGFIPKNFVSIDSAVVVFIGQQLNIKEATARFNQYGKRQQTRSDHLQIIEKYLGFKRLKSNELVSIKSWALSEAMEHDRPTYLLNQLIQKLKHDKIIRPSILTLERLSLSDGLCK